MAIPQAVMNIPGLTKQAYLNFQRLETYGFADCNPHGEELCMEASLFPIESVAKGRRGIVPGVVDKAQIDYHNIFTQLCAMIRDPVEGEPVDQPVNNSFAAIGENYLMMPGIIFCASLSSPPLHLNNRRVFDYDVNKAYIDHDHPNYKTVPVGARGQSIDQWLDEYAFLIMNNMIPHYIFNLPKSPGHDRYMWNVPPTEESIAAWRSWAGFNFFIDITETTILSYQFNVNQLLHKWELSQILIKLGEEGELDNLNHIKNTIIEILKVRFETYGILQLSLFEFITIASYNIAAYIKGEYQTANFVSYEHRARALRFLNSVKKAQDHNIRIYFTKRAGRFIHPNDTIPFSPEYNNGRTAAWLGVGQYMRYLVWAQRSFDYQGSHFFPCEKMIHRDAHACTTSVLSADLDQWFFQSCSAGDRVIMFGNSQQYHRPQHVTLNPAAPIPLAIHGDQGIDNIERLGVLAGVMWSRNPDRENRFLSYPLIRSPFISPLNPNRTFTDTPANSPWANPWGYGLDEYVLSLFFRRRAENPEMVGEVRVLAYGINWVNQHMTYIPENDPNEFWRPLHGVYHEVATAMQAQQGNPAFYNEVALACAGNPAYYTIGGPQTMLNTLFGNAMNHGFRVKVNKYNDIVPGNFSPNRKRNACNLKNFFRYDRFDYYNQPAVRKLNGQPLVLTNVTAAYKRNLYLALRLPELSVPARQGIPRSAIPEDVDPDAAFCARIPDGMAGGKRRKTLKKRK